MKNIHPSCPDCRIEMVEYYVGLVPIGVFQSLDKVTTYICKECGRTIFYAKEFPRGHSEQATSPQHSPKHHRGLKV